MLVPSDSVWKLSRPFQEYDGFLWTSNKVARFSYAGWLAMPGELYQMLFAFLWSNVGLWETHSSLARFWASKIAKNTQFWLFLTPNGELISLCAWKQEISQNNYSSPQREDLSHNDLGIAFFESSNSCTTVYSWNILDPWKPFYMIFQISLIPNTIPSRQFLHCSFEDEI